MPKMSPSMRALRGLFLFSFTHYCRGEVECGTRTHTAGFMISAPGQKISGATYKKNRHNTVLVTKPEIRYITKTDLLPFAMPAYY